MEKHDKHYLVPVDYSDKSVFGLKMANNLLKAGGGKVTVLNVIKGVNPILSDSFTSEEREGIFAKLKQHLEVFTSKYINVSGVEPECIIEKGKLCDTILKTADDVGASMIVMGTSTADNIKKWIIGTNALRVVTEATCPVITLKQNPDKENIQRIILPIDVTKESREKTVWAVQLAKMYSAEIYVVSAYTISDEFVLNKLNNYLNQTVDYIKEHNVKVSGEILKVGDRTSGVLDYIKEHDGDLIVITTHEQLELIHSFMGSFAKGIIRGATVPVLSIVPKIKHTVLFSMPAFGE